MRIVKRLAAALLGMAGLVATATAAQAIPVYYLDFGQWRAATAGAEIATEGFESSPRGRLAAGTTDLGLFDVTLSNRNRYTTIGNAAFGTQPGTVMNVFLNPTRGVRQMSWSGFDVAGTLHGLAFDVDLLDRSGLTIAVNGQSRTIAGGTDFIGVWSDDPIRSLSFTASNEYFELDNLQLAVAPVPVPPALGMFLAALAGVGVLGSWTRRRHA